MSVLLTILIIALIAFVAFWVIDQMGIGHPINVILKVIVGIIALIYLLNTVGGLPALH
jgi:hypothetical protein